MTFDDGPAVANAASLRPKKEGWPLADEADHEREDRLGLLDDRQEGKAGTPLLELGDPHALEIAVDVLTSDAVQIRPGATVSIERWGGDALQGRVRLSVTHCEYRSSRG
jgi:hypothetical protein